MYSRPKLQLVVTKDEAAGLTQFAHVLIVICQIRA